MDGREVFRQTFARCWAGQFSSFFSPLCPRAALDLLALILDHISRQQKLTPSTVLGASRSDITGALKALLVDYPYGADHDSAKVRPKPPPQPLLRIPLTDVPFPALLE